MNAKLWLSAVAVSAFLSGGAMAQVTGVVKLDGKAPEPKEIDMKAVKECAEQHTDPPVEEAFVASDKGELKNVVVSVKKEEGQDLPGDAPKDTAVLDQKGCQYHPHVLAVMVGQPFAVKNDDPFLHNVHSFSTANPPFNKGQPNKDDGMKIDPFKAAETIKVKCDVHPWMLAYIRVYDHPYFAVSGDDGKFTIPKGLADGEYTFVAWHEELGEQEAKATVKDGKAEGLTFTFKAPSAMGPDSPAKEAVAAKCLNGGACCTAKAASESLVKSPVTEMNAAATASAK
jgi:hypothetical protein